MSRSVMPPWSWLESVVVTLWNWMGMSGWGSARAASSPTVPAKAIAALKPLRSNVFCSAFPCRFHPGSSARALWMAASVARPWLGMHDSFREVVPANLIGIRSFRSTPDEEKSGYNSGHAAVPRVRARRLPVPPRRGAPSDARARARSGGRDLAGHAGGDAQQRRGARVSRPQRRVLAHRLRGAGIGGRALHPWRQAVHALRPPEGQGEGDLDRATCRDGRRDQDLRRGPGVRGDEARGGAAEAGGHRADAFL